MIKQAFLLSVFILLSAWALCSDVAQGKAYHPEFADSILGNHLPPLLLNSQPGLLPGEVATTWLYDVQPVMQHSNKSLVFAVFLLCMLIFLLVKFLYPDYFAATAEGFMNLHFYTQLFRSNEYGEIIPFVLMAIFRCLVLSLAILLIWLVLTEQASPRLLPTYLLIFVLTGVTVVLKSLAEYLFNFFAGSLQLIRVYFVQVTIIFNVMSLLILPVLLIMLYQHQLRSEWVFGLLSAWLVVSVLMYLVRSVQVVPARSIMNFMHFILYICAFEIIPWMLLVRIIVNVSG